jgi:hypothetical protein
VVNLGMESVAIIRCGSVGTKKLDRADRTDRKRVLDRTNSTQALFSTWEYRNVLTWTCKAWFRLVSRERTCTIYVIATRIIGLFSWPAQEKTETAHTSTERVHAAPYFKRSLCNVCQRV